MDVAGYSGSFHGGGIAPTVSISSGPCIRLSARQRLRDIGGVTATGRTQRLYASFEQFPALLDQRRHLDLITLCDSIEAAFPHESGKEAFVHTSYYRGLAERDDGNPQAAIASFRRSCAFAEKLGLFGEAGRAMAAEGNIRLRDRSPQERDEGARLVQLAVCMKIRCSHNRRSGIGSDFVTLSGYALSESRLSRALGYGRRGLKLSLDEGRPAEIIEALDNMVRVYLASRLFNQARDTANSAVAWADANGTHAFIERASSLKDTVRKAMRTRGGLPDVFICPCPANEDRSRNGGKPYRFEACCGPADREPLELDWGHCLAPQHGPYRALPESTAFNFTLGEYIDKEGSRGYPQGFLGGRFHDGWLETYGLPHLAHYHLHGARAACEASVGQDVGFPIAAVLLAVCSLEAFVNGVAHIEPRLEKAFRQDRETAALSSENGESEIVRKWIRAGSELCHEHWLAPEHLASLQSLIRLRNKLVHFKPEWEPLDDPSRKVQKLGCEQREDVLWWPHRLLTKDAAGWAVKVAEQVIKAFSDNLREECRHLSVSPDRVKASAGERPSTHGKTSAVTAAGG